MNKYKVDHTGTCRSKDGQIYSFTAGVPVELPDDVAAALGNDAELFEKKVEKAEKKVEKKEEKKVEHAPKDKMVKGDDVSTK